MKQQMNARFEAFIKNSKNIQNLFLYINDAVILFDDKNRAIAVNPAFEQITGYSFAEVYGRNYCNFSIRTTPHIAINNIPSTLKENRYWTGEIQFFHKEGFELFSLATITYVEGEQGCYSIAVIRDATKQKIMENEIKSLAYYDTLTKLPNRRSFFLTVEKGLDAIQAKYAAVLYLDLDYFKKVNDYYGHEQGDVLLVAIADRLKDVVLTKGTLSRVGGDEFAVFLPDLKVKQEAISMADSIIDALHPLMQIHGEKIETTASIGISYYPEHGKDAQTLFKNADFAMYYSKQQGRNAYHIYNPKDIAATIQRYQFEKELRAAVKNEEFEVYYQLQMDIQSGKMYGAEALVRWNHPENGVLSPFAFLPLADETGIIVDIDDWVMKKACIQAKKWIMSGLDLIVSVNVSQKQFDQPNFVCKVNEVLQSNELDPRFFCIEITEDIAIKNVEEAIHKIKSLKKLGVQVSLDDFGTGYSSLSKLKTIPIDTLKIDQSFVRGTEELEQNYAIVKLIIAMAKTLNFSVICEGVETTEQLSLIRNEGCHHAQGFYFSKPLTAENCEVLMLKMKQEASSPNVL
ncbi:EAL and GGDEF domain-containing protein [Bacillus alkalicellulosilyticus]|uniref:sensor domain-containing protein n=1 Tax=Alkalihalobacterium alkalicellulosilyticum TaxID=1912214 RepID=UPI0009976C5A|nr:EAL domain-containing protein [Bacillus alkalicellulosilyticus]